MRYIVLDTNCLLQSLPSDVDDNKFVDCAIASNAELIVTNDKDFSPLKSIPWPKVEIMRIEQFMKIIK